jgi:uncharacterized protein YdaU (DUF1376 family)
VSKKLPWYKRDVDAWRGGTRSMSLELRGFYSEFLDAMWDRQGPVENDVAKLAITLCCNPRTVRKLLPQLIALGKIIETPEGLINARMMGDLSAAIGRELERNSAGIRTEFEPKVPEKRVFSTRDLDTDSDEEKDKELKCSKNSILGLGRGGVVSAEAKRTVCANLGLIDAEPLVARFAAWPPSRGAHDVDAMFIASAETLLKNAPDDVKAKCVPAPIAAEPLPPVQYSDALKKSVRKGTRYGHPVRPN